MASYRSRGIQHYDPLSAGADTNSRWQFAYVFLTRPPGPRTKYCFEGVVRRTVDCQPAKANFQGRDQIVLIGCEQYPNNQVLGNGTIVRWELSDHPGRLNVQKQILLRAVNQKDEARRTVIVKVRDGAVLRPLRIVGCSRRVAADDTRTNKRKAAVEQETQLRLSHLIRKRVRASGL
jgi:hypothetical protein